MTSNGLSSEPGLSCEHFQLWQRCRSRLPKTNGGFVRSINAADSAECFQSTNFMRVSSTESFPDTRVLRNLCQKARLSEEFFMTVCKSQWLRTIVKFPRTSGQPVEEASIHSNVLPCGQFWTDDASRSVQFPCSILDEALHEDKLLRDKLREWKQHWGEGCGIGKHEHEVGKIDLSSPLKIFWEISPYDPDLVEFGKVGDSNSAGLISQVKWRGGTFIRKNLANPEEFEKEFSAVQRLCHPHIVYIFGSCQGLAAEYALYMECMENDLYCVILDLVRPERDHTSPPFSYHDSVDILLQIAKAMAHMHENELIHGDLKSLNVLISKLEISQGQYRYLAKVADFGQTQVKNSERFFESAMGTTRWAAPEIIKFNQYKKRKDEKLMNKMIEDISVWPESTDVYSFGIIAFEVLTGMDPYCGMTGSAVTKGVMNDALELNTALPLREKCKKYKFPIYIMNLIPLIESCWKAPRGRPSFSKIVEELVMVRSQISEAASSASNGQYSNGPRKVSCGGRELLRKLLPSCRDGYEAQIPR